MLRIKNKEKIKGEWIKTPGFYTAWQVESISDAINWNMQTKVQYKFYSIRIKNNETGVLIDVELHRDKTSDGGLASCNWYKLSCRISGKENIHYIGEDALKNMDRLLESIKLVAKC